MENDITKQQLQSLRAQAQISQQQLNSLQSEKRLIENQINQFKSHNQALSVEAQKKQQQLPLIEKQILEYQSNIQKLDQQIVELDANFKKLNMIQNHIDNLDHILKKYSSIEGVRIDQSTMMVRKLPQNELLNSDLPKEVCKKKCLDDFKEILLKMKDINAVNSEGQTLLMLTLSNGFYEAVELLLNIPEIDCNITDNKGLNALMYACRFPNIKYVKLIADRTDNLNYQCKELNNDSAIHMLINNDENIIYEDEIDEIIEIGSSGQVIFIGGVNKTVLMGGNNKSISLGKRTDDHYCYADAKVLIILKYFAVKDGNINLQNDQGFTPFRLACFNKMNYLANNLKNTEGLINLENEKDLISYNSMNWITLGQDIEQAKKLLNTDLVDINYQDNIGNTLSNYACQNNWPNMLKFLMIQSANLNIPNKEGAYPIHYAAQNGHFELVKLLLPKTDVNIKTQAEHQVTPLWLAAQNGHLETVKYLVEHKANVDAIRVDSGLSAVYIAALQNKINVIEYLLVNKADPNIPNASGYYPIHGAIHNNNLDLIKILITNNANINIQNIGEKSGITPLYYAMGYAGQKVDVAIVKYLLVNKADPNIPNASGYYPIHSAIHNSNLELVKILIENNVDVNVKSIGKESGITPLYYAMGYGGQKVDVSIVEYLLEQKANPNSKVFDGDTPMHMAGYHSRIDLLKKLLAYNGDLNVVNNNNETLLYSCIKEETIHINPAIKLAFVKYLIAKGVTLNLEAEPNLIELANKHLPSAIEFLQHPEIVTNIAQLEIELTGEI